MVRTLGVTLVAVMLLVSGAVAALVAPPAEGRDPLLVFARPTNSSPIALSQDNTLLWVVNPDDDSVSVIRTDTNAIIRRIGVGKEPQSLAVDPNNQFVYVANAADNTVTVIKITNASPATFVAAVDTSVGVGGSITTGAEPWNVVISPDGNRVFVANSGQDTITVINATTRTVIGNVDLRNSLCNGATGIERERHFQPRGLAVTLDNTKLYVTRFLSFVTSTGVQGSDIGKEGVVCRLAINTLSTNIADYTPAAIIPLAAQVTGFTIDSNGDTIPDATSAYPNQLQSIVIRGNSAYLPNIAASPSRPLRFNVDTHAFVNRIDNLATAETDGGALNLHLGARVPEAGKTRLFFANPWAIAFTNQAALGNAYVASSGSDLLVKLNVDATGVLSFTNGVSTTRYIDLNDSDVVTTTGVNAGKNPLGLAINDLGTTAYVFNHISRNVSVVNLTTDAVSTVIKSTDLPFPGTLDETIHVGAEQFFASRGRYNRPPGTTVSTEDRLSSEGWQACSSCHFAGWTDSVVWQFGTGPRKSVPLNATWNPSNPNDQRVLNYSAIFDEVQDFEANIRNVSGPGNLSAGPPPVLNPAHGLIVSDTTSLNNAPLVVNAFALKNEGRPQHTVTLPGSTVAVPALDALKEWVRFAIRTPNGKLTTTELTAGGGSPTGGLSTTDVTGGRTLFAQAGCVTCHGGGKWTNSVKDFASPPAAAEITVETDTNGATAPNPNLNQYLNRFLREIGSFNLNVPGSGIAIPGRPLIGAVEIDATGRDGLGKDHDGDGKGAGFNIPSLLGILTLQPYYHNGSCETLACVVDNVTHRRAGLPAGQTDPLDNATNRSRLIAFMETIDAETPVQTNLKIDASDIFFDPPTVFASATVTVGANVSIFGPKVPTFLPGPLRVRFTDVTAGTTIGEANLVGIPADNGSVPVTISWTVPPTSTVRQIRVDVDVTNLFLESNETDNSATRSILVRPAQPDTTPPVVSNVRINDGASFTTSPTVTVKFDAVDPLSSSQPTSGLATFCLVRYEFDAVNRVWVESPCTFVALPPAVGGSFAVSTTLPVVDGVAYTFVWVKDNAGNVSRTPGFDVISVVPPPTGGEIDLNRNDVRVFRFTLEPGQAMSVTATPIFGDVDISVFAGINANSPRVATSANSGTVSETVTFSVPVTGTQTTFQVEVRASVTSRFRLSVSQTTGAAPPQPAAVTPQSPLPPEPIISGAPPLQPAIDTVFDPTLPPARYFLPFAVKQTQG